jgi:signal transduction protein with GAF and PtsI domain
VAGNLRIMLPMITAPAEVTQVRALLAQAAAEPSAERRPRCRRRHHGRVPAAASRSKRSTSTSHRWFE